MYTRKIKDWHDKIIKFGSRELEHIVSFTNLTWKYSESTTKRQIHVAAKSPNQGRSLIHRMYIFFQECLHKLCIKNCYFKLVIRAKWLYCFIAKRYPTFLSLETYTGLKWEKVYIGRREITLKGFDTKSPYSIHDSASINCRMKHYLLVNFFQRESSSFIQTKSYNWNDHYDFKQHLNHHSTILNVQTKFCTFYLAH